MKRTLFTFATVLAFSAIGFGQKDTPRAGETRSDGNITSQGNSSASTRNDGGTINAGTMLQGELQSTIDVNKSRVGDRVILKTTKAVKQGKETIVPKGAQLVGRITEIAKRSKDNAQSRIGMLFERVEGKNLSQPLTATVVSITRANAGAGFDDNDGFASGGLDTSGSASADPVRQPVRGGVVRSTTQGLVGTVANTASIATNTVANTAGTATRTVGPVINNTGNAVRNIDLAASGSANSSASLSSNDKNFRIEKGATFNLRVVN